MRLHPLVLAAALVILAAIPSRAQSPQRRPASDTGKRLAGVIVTATRDSISPLSSPLPTGALNSAELRRDHGVSLAQTLTRLAGVGSLSAGAQIGKPVIRGLSGSRVLVLDDGLRLEDYAWSDEDGPSIDARLPSEWTSFADPRACVRLRCARRSGECHSVSDPQRPREGTDSSW